MRKLLLGLVAVAAVATPVALVAAPAEAAGNKPCITKAEFGKIHKGQTVQRVKQIVGGNGTQTYYDGGYPGQYGWPASQWREYNQCGGKYTGSADVDYEKRGGVWRVTSKSAFWYNF